MDELAERLLEGELREGVETFLREQFCLLMPARSGSLNDVVFRVKNETNPGVWTSPDFIVARIWKGRVISTPTLEVITFELKRSGQIDIKAVMQCVVHMKRAHQSYLIGSEMQVDSPRFLDAVKRCREFGVGLLSFTNAAALETYKLHVPAVAQPLDVRLVDDILAEHACEQEINRIRRLMGFTA